METMSSISRTQLITVLVLILVVVGLVVFGGRGKEVSQETGSVVLNIEWPSTEVKQERVEDDTKDYHIAVIYPITQSDTVNAYFKTFADETVVSFKTDLLANTVPTEDTATYQSTLDMSYRKEKHLRADNYIFLTSTDNGGAHGFTTTKTFSFSKNGTLIGLESLFTNGLAGLETIVPYVRGQLAKQISNAATQWIEDGTQPTADAFASFVVTDEGVTFIFDPYQVASYAEGKQEVAVPLSVFKSIANPEVFTQ